jgi:hypothetical protein
MPKRTTINVDPPYRTIEHVKRIRFNVDRHVPQNKAYSSGHTAHLDFQMNRVGKWLEVIATKVTSMKDRREMRHVITVTLDHGEVLALKAFIDEQLAYEVLK